MTLKVNGINIFIDKEKGYKVFVKDDKNYLEKSGKIFELPSGKISIIDSVVFIGNQKIDISNY